LEEKASNFLCSAVRWFGWDFSKRRTHRKVEQKKTYPANWGLQLAPEWETSALARWERVRATQNLMPPLDVRRQANDVLHVQMAGMCVRRTDKKRDTQHNTPQSSQSLFLMHSAWRASG
jgi:hypothetical protein